jgi:hypothetical protein
MKSIKNNFLYKSYINYIFVIFVVYLKIIQNIKLKFYSIYYKMYINNNKIIIYF